jgi:antirestriction protein ArdC
MKSQELLSHLKSRIEELAQAVDQARASREMLDYLSSMAKFHRYSAANCMLILSQCPHATKVAGFMTWKRLFGRQVNRGETGIKILAPMPYTTTEQDPETREEIEVRKLWFKVVHVFDISQTRGQPLPEVDWKGSGRQERLESALIAYAQSLGIEVQRADLGHACGVSLKGKILFSEDGNVPRTLAHEIVHETASVTACRAVREILTDAAAHVVCLHFGVDPGQSTANYIALWQGTADDVLENMEFIRGVAHTVIDGVTEVLEKRDSRPSVALPETTATSEQNETRRRKLKVYPLYTGKYPPDPYSKIRLQGKWVQDAGFQAGDPIVVEVRPEQLVIKKGAS